MPLFAHDSLCKPHTCSGWPPTLLVLPPQMLCAALCAALPRRPLREGDVVNIDVTCYLNGYHGDTSRTFVVGSPTPRAKRLVEANEEALREAIKVSWLRHRAAHSQLAFMALLSPCASVESPTCDDSGMQQGPESTPGNRTARCPVPSLCGD